VKGETQIMEENELTREEMAGAIMGLLHAATSLDPATRESILKYMEQVGDDSLRGFFFYVKGLALKLSIKPTEGDLYHAAQTMVASARAGDDPFICNKFLKQIGG